MLLDPTQVRVVTLGSEEFLELETARRGKKRLYYTAKAGDTLSKIGPRYGLTPGDLARINRFSYNTELHEGDRVVVYSPTGELPRETHDGDDARQEAARARRPDARAPKTAPEERSRSDGIGRPRPVAKTDARKSGQAGKRDKAARRPRRSPTRPAARRSSAAPLTRRRVEPGSAGQRVDHAVAAGVPGLSIAAANACWPPAPSHRRPAGREGEPSLAAGQTHRRSTTPRWPPTGADGAAAVLPGSAAWSLAVLYADAAMVAIAKPAGHGVPSAAPGQLGTAANAICARFPECAAASPDPARRGPRPPPRRRHQRRVDCGPQRRVLAAAEDGAGRPGLREDLPRRGRGRAADAGVETALDRPGRPARHPRSRGRRAPPSAGAHGLDGRRAARRHGARARAACRRGGRTRFARTWRQPATRSWATRTTPAAPNKRRERPPRRAGLSPARGFDPLPPPGLR